MTLNGSIKRSIEVVLKVIDACNNKCHYCFYFGSKDRNLDRLDEFAITTDSVDEIADFLQQGCYLLGLDGISIIIHGGEPLLMPVHHFDYLCQQLHKKIGEVVKQVRFGVQTNGTLISKEWIDIFNKYQIIPSISIDGYEACHDNFRKDFNNEGTYKKVVDGIVLLQSSTNDNLKNFGTLTVINPSYSAKKDIPAFY